MSATADIWPWPGLEPSRFGKFLVVWRMENPLWFGVSPAPKQGPQNEVLTHLLWFERLLSNHFEGIIAHATYDISAAKIEDINNKIKTLRRQGYGYPDDEYFFLKLFDMSRRDYVRNPKSHKFCD